MITSPSAAYYGDPPLTEIFTSSAPLPSALRQILRKYAALQGVKPLSLRVQHHCDNALAVAKYLEAHLKDAFGGMLMFHVEGGFEQVKKVINNLELASHLANLGDAKTLVIAPFITVQSQLTPQERELTGVTDDTIRYSVGVKDAANIIEPIRNSQTGMRNWRLVPSTFHSRNLAAEMGYGLDYLPHYFATTHASRDWLRANDPEPGWCGHFDNCHPVLCPVLAPPLYTLVLYARIIG
ncbi:pyridoxal phosphate-dependent transferase [Mycena albidolilacea]|uniref:Pyridoxal phosphate-dependent transferase n=1 Tax=Mycena albidolilacea TaxID=1033008 RepID=A0AAD6Z2P2_9AGAR|nr:pyridoxal phosphate-dependent transferase [Mycena albidolilacea]